MNFDGSEPHQESVIQTISINRFERPKTIIQVSRPQNDSFREICISKILKLLNLDQNSIMYENVRKLLAEEGFCLDFNTAEIIDDDMTNVNIILRKGRIFVLFI